VPADRFDCLLLSAPSDSAAAATPKHTARAAAPHDAEYGHQRGELATFGCRSQTVSSLYAGKHSVPKQQCSCRVAGPYKHATIVDHSPLGQPFNSQTGVGLGPPVIKHERIVPTPTGSHVGRCSAGLRGSADLNCNATDSFALGPRVTVDRAGGPPNRKPERGRTRLEKGQKADQENRVRDTRGASALLPARTPKSSYNNELWSHGSLGHDPTLDHCDHRLPLLAVGQYPTRRTRWLLSLIVLVADAVVSFTA